MKLKKIASLMLAGIMAVSMLAGCKSGTPDPDDNGGASSNTTSSFTQSVLAATNDVTKLRLSAADSTKLEEAVEWAARNDRGTNITDIALKNVPTTWGIVSLAEKSMTGANVNAYTEATNWSFAPANVDTWQKNDPYTYWTLYVVSRTVSDEYIVNEMAKKLDNWAASMANDGQVISNHTYDYTVSVAMADCAGGDLDTKNDDFVIIGVAVTADRDTVNY